MLIILFVYCLICSKIKKFLYWNIFCLKGERDHDTPDWLNNRTRWCLEKELQAFKSNFSLNYHRVNIEFSVNNCNIGIFARAYPAFILFSKKLKSSIEHLFIFASSIPKNLKKDSIRPASH